MGIYKKYFCMEIPTTLLCMGIIMGIFSFSIFVGDFVLSLLLMINSTKLDPYFFAFMIFAMLVYCLAGIFQSMLCCRRDYSRDINKYFNVLIVFSTIAAACAIAGGIWKLLLDAIINAVVLFIYAFVTFVAVLIAYFAKRELFLSRLDELQKFNNLQGPVVLTDGFDGIPRYPMALNIESIRIEDP